MKQQLDRTCSPQEKAYPLFDMHVATDAPSEGLVFAREELREKFEAWGFSHDELVHHGLTFGPRTATAYESCPLIDIHMSKKFSGEHGSITMKETERKVIEAMTAAGLPGYFHSEFVVKDIHVFQHNLSRDEALTYLYHSIDIKVINGNKVGDILELSLESYLQQTFMYEVVKEMPFTSEAKFNAKELKINNTYVQVYKGAPDAGAD
jgi:hypothetical protein